MKITENTIIDLQTRLAFQDGLLEQLNQVITQQQHTIMKLEKRLDAMQTQLHSIQASQMTSGEITEPPPPHY